MTSWLASNWFKLAILTLLSVAIGGTAYYFFAFQPKLNLQERTENNIVSIATSTTATSTSISATQALDIARAATAVKSSSAITNNSDSIPPDLLLQIMARIVLVKCYGNGGVWQGTGTAQLIRSSNPVVVTNFHVLSAAGGVSATCTVNIPNPPDYSPGDLFTTQIGKFDTHYPNVDAGVLNIESLSSPHEKIFQSFPLPFCDDGKVQIGDRVTLFGYPAFGQSTNEQQNSLTVTDGIISGFLTNTYGHIYKTSAKVDHGISGGLAVLNKSACVLGIPTWANYGGTGEALGQIQSWSSIKKSGDIFNTPNTDTPPAQTNTSQSTQQPGYTSPAQYQPTAQDDEIAAENFYNINHTCVGLSGRQYEDCITYAYNH